MGLTKVVGMGIKQSSGQRCNSSCAGQVRVLSKFWLPSALAVSANRASSRWHTYITGTVVLALHKEASRSQAVVELLFFSPGSAGHAVGVALAHSVCIHRHGDSRGCEKCMQTLCQKFGHQKCVLAPSHGLLVSCWYFTDSLSSTSDT